MVFFDTHKQNAIASINSNIKNICNKIIECILVNSQLIMVVE